MTEPAALVSSEFAAFFKEVHGHDPFPWQSRLSARLAAGHDWPSVIDLPTGTGKTALLDVAVFQLAMQATAVTRTAALRIVYVVDRRTIVDQAHERVMRITEAIENGASPLLARVRARLARYGRDGVPLRSVLLRGAIARNDTWARSPDQPLIVLSTVDQVGSRLLFRGYGVSDTMKPIHAGLLGNDVLYLLDEVHLSRPFRETLEAVGHRYGKWATHPLPRPFTVVEMSATPGTPRTGTFRLEPEDENHAALAGRLSASKPTTLVLATPRSFLDEIESAVKPLVSRRGATVAVVVNRVAAAREIHERLKAAFAGIDVHLITGRMRPVDRNALEMRIIPRISASRARDASAPPIIVVATQCIEAGADLDFDGLVTECASLDALRQRFGRLDRLGRNANEARGVIVARSDALSDDPVYGDALGKTWAWLAALTGGRKDGTIDFGIRGLSVPHDADELGLLSPAAHAPVLLPSHIDAWVQTSPKPTPDPDVALWLHGPDRGVADVQVIWRADVSAEVLQATGSETQPGLAVAARDVLLGSIGAVTPASGEAMAVPFAAARRWLDGRSEPPTFDVEGSREVTFDDWKADQVRATRRAIAWRGDASDVVEPSGIRPGDTLIVPSTYGGIANGTWAPGATEAIVDAAEVTSLRQRGRAVLRMHPAVIIDLLGAAAPAPPVPAPLDAESIDDREAVSEWLSRTLSNDLEPAVIGLLTALAKESSGRGLRVERLPRSVEPADGEYFVVSTRSRVSFDGSEVSTEDDRASFTGVEVPLVEHLAGVRDVAGQFADSLQLPSAIAADVRLAGRWHDVGKIDPRFQRLLHGGSAFKAIVQDEPIAKSAAAMSDWRARERAERRSKYPRGARHELMSLALMESAGDRLVSQANDWDLVQHLVASHHGRCRPLAPWIADPQPVDMLWSLDGIDVAASSAHELARLDSGAGERFWRLVRRYGWWGLAWIETVLRLGDHRRSEEEQQLPRRSA